MEKFRQSLRTGLSKAEALHLAQINIWAEYPHPKCWAASMLTGNADALA